MHAIICLSAFLLIGLFPLYAQGPNDTDYPHEFSLNAGFQGSTHKNKSSIFGALYSAEYARFYPGRIGFRTGLAYFDVRHSNFNLSVPMYFAIRTNIDKSIKDYDEDTPLLIALLLLLPNRLEFDAGIRPGITSNIPSEKLHSDRTNRFSYAMHAGARITYCLGRVELALIPSYDYYFTSDLRSRDDTCWSFLSFSGALTFRLKR